ncbi:DNA-3-methyladenine glycosylase [Yimella sp. cx-51]|uniref:DNA-3-methyladenine glycosylase family protein n=1 Tax=Yimella sp. cx-51 TaxID=2770551 RepID=UPI00165E9A8C|nr:DNA-3-methyladenine glycosylase 2 family protein [Yimella sp. cx-51]MBC9955580.1 DNA-3-methyladenine glycosylase 2 family protein [Yimella sp. cx-51]QTH37844.1 DNA-3-methyladenine glycosylase 2 family protein [Yimella sp. cx-51]
MEVIETIELPVPQPYDADGVFAFLAARAVDRVELVERSDATSRYVRTLALPGGPGLIDVVHDGEVLPVTVHAAAAADVAPAVRLVSALFDLDHDAAAADSLLADDPSLADVVARNPGIRVPGGLDPHELVVRALVGQQISVAAARTHLGRLAQFCGTPCPTQVSGVDRLFPSAASIAASVPVPPPGQEPLDPNRPMRLPRRSIGDLVSTAAVLADGSLRVAADMEASELRAALIARPGIGEWTAAYLAMRVLHDPDAWLTGDVALVAGARRLGIIDDSIPTAKAHRPLAEHASRWSPYRSYAAMHLWRVAAQG